MLRVVYEALVSTLRAYELDAATGVASLTDLPGLSGSSVDFQRDLGRFALCSTTALLFVHLQLLEPTEGTRQHAF
jgi:hypothetical protein